MSEEEQKKKRSLPLLARLNDETVAAAVHDAIAGELDAGTSPIDVSAHAFELYEDALAQVEARVPPAAARACATGCAYCCHLKVAISPVEALHLGSVLRKKLDSGALARLAKKVKQTDARTRGMDTAERAVSRIPCPLLGDDARCIAYEARPMACAGANSFDREQCKKGFESSAEDDVEIPNYGPQHRVAAAAREGVAGALFERGLDGRVLELIAALVVVLNTPDAKSKWTQRQPIFEPALDEEFARLLRHRP